MEYLELFFKSIFIDNMVFATFLGMCSYLAWQAGASDNAVTRGDE